MSRAAPLPRLTSLRFFAAAGVVIFHLHVWEVGSLPWQVSKVGYVGVTFFFTLSGLVLAWGTEPGLAALRFYRRRFARVWPSHVVVFGIAAVVPVVAVARGVPEAIPNILLVQSWWHDYRIVFGMNGVAWTLSCEAFFYATFPVLVRVFSRSPAWVPWVISAAMLSVSFAAGFVAPGYSHHLPLTRLGEFVLGMAAGLALRRGWRPALPSYVTWAAAAAGFGLAYLLRPPLANAPLAGVFLVLLLAAVARDLRGDAGWLTGRYAVFAGEASFALYLVHELVIINLKPVLPLSAPLVVGVMLLAAAVCAVALHLLVERPCNALLRGRSRSIALAPPQEVSRQTGVAGMTDSTKE
ncbi:acyltransferase family protein [Blastococcus sp. SYSU D00669]